MKEIFINKKEHISKIVLIENGNLVEKYEDDDRAKRLEGKIYIGEVQNVLQGMQAAFVNIGEEKNTFIHLKDILPKINVVTNQKNQEEQDIRKVVKKGDRLLVQVKRDATSIKGAKVSTHISIPSRYFVLMPNTDIRTISQKIESKDERDRLNRIVLSILPDNFGVIIRTSALNKKQEDLERDLKSVLKLWEDICKEADVDNQDIPKILYEGQSFIEKLLIDLIDADIQKIVVNSEKDYDEIKRILGVLGENIGVELNKSDKIFDTYDINEQLEKSEQRKIWLNCGGFITIDKTEALTAIDVNSGKYTGNKDLEQTVFKVNKEASIEIAKQLRLRDIGGIIIIDYIDMSDETHRKKIIEELEENFKKDRSKTQIVGFSKLNLLEMTRKHMKGGE